MHILLISLLLFVVLFGPQLWVKAVMKRHAGPRPDYPGTGGEFARHLLSQLQRTGIAWTHSSHASI